MQEYLHNALKDTAILQQCGVNNNTTMGTKDSSFLSCE
jgi:hypothetical protein